MEIKNKAVTFPRMENRWGNLLIVLLLTVLCGALIWAMLTYGEANDAFFAVFLGLLMLSLDGMLLYWGLTTVTVCQSGITLAFGKYALKHLRADEVRTILKVVVKGKRPITMLRCLSAPASTMEAKGEQRLSKNRFLREELKFRRNKADWGDICLNAGLPKTGGLWIEFTPELLALLQKMFPNAAYREPKRYDEPPSLV